MPCEAARQLHVRFEGAWSAVSKVLTCREPAARQMILQRLSRTFRMRSSVYERATGFNLVHACRGLAASEMVLERPSRTFRVRFLSVRASREFPSVSW